MFDFAERGAAKLVLRAAEQLAEALVGHHQHIVAADLGDADGGLAEDGGDVPFAFGQGGDRRLLRGEILHRADHAQGAAVAPAHQEASIVDAGVGAVGFQEAIFLGEMLAAAIITA